MSRNQNSMLPKNKNRQARFEAWLRAARIDDLTKSYASALKQGNKYQKTAIVGELRRRELVSEGVV